MSTNIGSSMSFGPIVPTCKQIKAWRKAVKRVAKFDHLCFVCGCSSTKVNGVFVPMEKGRPTWFCVPCHIEYYLPIFQEAMVRHSAN